MTELKLGSLFDGIGGFPLAATMNDIRPVWASEIEPFPMAVTAYRFPQMKHMGDITKLHGANLPVVDVIAGGLPLSGFICGGQERGACRGEVRLIHGTGTDCKRNEKTGQKEDEKP